MFVICELLSLLFCSQSSQNLVAQSSQNLTINYFVYTVRMVEATILRCLEIWCLLFMAKVQCVDIW
uniref:Uncharacterized protein n=1 Tax=Rhizophora mucronata TaxID=61149 RepID=A0A2P2KSM8_RHIMU